MSARAAGDPASATPVAGDGSRRPGVVWLLVAAVLLTALVQGLVLQSHVVPTAALAPAVEPGDRVLVWKVRPSPDPGDLVLVDTTDSAPVERSTPVSVWYSTRTRRFPMVGGIDVSGHVPIPDGALWFDLLDPTAEERLRVEAALTVQLPSREEMQEIEPSSRLYTEGVAT